MSRRRKTSDDKMVELLEQGIKDVLGDPKSMPADKIRAVEAGTKLQLMKHKVSGGQDDGNYFE